MKKRTMKAVLYAVPVVLAASLLVLCATGSELEGKWRQVGKDATVEFFHDGTFRAVDNEGLAVSGSFHMDDKGDIRFEIAHPGSSPEVVRARVTLKDDELTFAFPYSREVERYKRQE